MGSSVTLDDVGQKIPLEDMQFHRGTVADLLAYRLTTGTDRPAVVCGEQ